MSEEEKAIKWLEKNTKNYKLDSEELHYMLVLFNLIIYLRRENKKYKEVINKANKWIRDYMDEWNMNDEVWQDLNDLLILLEEVKHE